jgi:GrpB-like predicted nucleotidyltransferase (UPF0157 family)
MSLEELWQLFPIMLSNHKQVWKEWYSQEKFLIVNTVGIWEIERINHIGSTAVDGLIAKPTIDILIEIIKDCDLENLINKMESIGYIYEKQPQKPLPHMMFMKGYTENGFAKKSLSCPHKIFGKLGRIIF